MQEEFKIDCPECRVGLIDCGFDHPEDGDVALCDRCKRRFTMLVSEDGIEVAIIKNVRGYR